MGKQNFKIDNTLYSDEIIIQGGEDFKDVAVMNYNNGELIIETSDNDEEEIFNEFMNYIIGLHNELI